MAMHCHLRPSLSPEIGQVEAKFLMIQNVFPPVFEGVGDSEQIVIRGE